MTQAAVRLDAGVITEDALVVCCFPSVGMVSSVVAHFLIDHLELEFVGAVTHPQLPALCLVQNGEPFPPIRAYAGDPVCKIDDCDRVILLMSELVVPDPLVHDIVTALFDWSKDSKARRAVLIDAFARKGIKSGGLNGQEPVVEYDDTEEIDVLGVGANPEMVKILEDLGIQPLEQGVIKGMTGVMLGEGRRRNRNVMSIMVEADPRFPDARAAAVVIEHLNKLLPMIDLDHAPLMAEAESLEEQIRSMMEGAQPSLGDGSSSSNSMLYG
ncbi:MAG: proteasome assembly chaperone family protein [Candidatus Poseidoniales archaeon]|jgi:uncharacterized protein